MASPRKTPKAPKLYPHQEQAVKMILDIEADQFQSLDRSGRTIFGIDVAKTPGFGHGVLMMTGADGKPQQLAVIKNIDMSFRPDVYNLLEKPGFDFSILDTIMKKKDQMLMDALMGINKSYFHTGVMCDPTSFDMQYKQNARWHDDPRNTLMMESRQRLEKTMRERDAIDLVSAPVIDSVDMTWAHDLLWGPNGEYLGLPRLAMFDDFIAYGDHLEPKSGNARGFEEVFLHSHIGIVPLGLSGRGNASSRDAYRFAELRRHRMMPSERAFLLEGRVLGFTSYEDIAQYLDILAHFSSLHSAAGYGRRHRGDEILLTSLFMVCPPDRRSVDAWLRALDGKEYDFGFGLLRDEDDRFDALGVLAEIGEVAWEFDEDEGAYAAEGDTNTLGSELFQSLLGMPTNQHDKTHKLINQAVNMIADVCAGSKDFQPIFRMINVAMQEAKTGMEQLKGLTQSIYSPQAYQGDNMATATCYRPDIRWRV